MVLCTPISNLMKHNKDNIFSNKSYETNCSMKDKPKVAKLVGDKCFLQCVINNTNIPVLMDKGAQVSIIEQEY